jgi:hypothetical protein
MFDFPWEAEFLCVRILGDVRILAIMQLQVAFCAPDI